MKRQSIIFPLYSSVKVCVHPQHRQFLSECHTAGHVVDAAMSVCGKLFPPMKGYHFLEGPYVEYKGSIDVHERDEFLHALQLAYTELVEEDTLIDIQFLPMEKAESICNRLSKNFNMLDFITNCSPSSSSSENLSSSSTANCNDNNIVRVVTVAGWNCPCGGTHVRSTGVLKERGWGVRGLKCRKDVVRVRYGPKDGTIMGSTET